MSHDIEHDAATEAAAMERERTIARDPFPVCHNRIPSGHVTPPESPSSAWNPLERPRDDWSPRRRAR